MKAEQGGFDRLGVLGAAYSHIGNNFRYVLGAPLLFHQMI
jgi:hypothetical protein